MSAVMVVGPQPAVKRTRTLAAVAVDRCVGPASEHRADKPLGLPVGLRPVRARAQMPDAQGTASDRMHRGAVRVAVVGQQALDGNPIAVIEGHRTAQESDRGGRSLVAKDLRVGQARAVVNRHVAELPAVSLERLIARNALAMRSARHSPPGPGHAPELLDVDVDELSWSLALVALRRLQA